MTRKAKIGSTATPDCYAGAGDDMPDRLMKRGATYYFRARYPTDLRDHFTARERWKSLGTTDFREAKRLLAVENVRFDAEMGELRTRAASPARATLTPEEVNRIAAAYFHDLMSEDEEHREEGLTDREFRSKGESLDIVKMGAKDDLARGNTRFWQEEFDDWLGSNGHKLEPASAAHRTVLNRMLKEFVRFLNASSERQEGEVVDTPPAPKPEELGPTVGDLIDDYMSDPSRNRAPKTVMSYRITFDALAELVGKDRRARDVTRGDCERIRDVLLRLPSNARKKYPGVPLATAADLGARDGAQTLSRGTVNAYLENLSSLFKWGVKTWRIERNPALGLSVHDDVAAKDKGKAFPLTSLPAVFAAPLFTGCQNDEAGYATSGPNLPRRGRFWVPLLSLFHGIRMGEACQLHTADVQKMGETWVLKLSDEEEEGTDEADRKRIKSAAGHRYVPVHPELVSIGFLTFVDGMKDAGSKRLFPETLRSADGHFSAFSQWFGRFTEKAGVKQKRVTFHSFRHSYRDALRRAEVPRDIVIALGGWAGRGTDDDYGDGNLTPEQLARHVARVSYPGLDLTHLYVAS